MDNDGRRGGREGNDRTSNNSKGDNGGISNSSNVRIDRSISVKLISNEGPDY